MVLTIDQPSDNDASESEDDENIGNEYLQDSRAQNCQQWSNNALKYSNWI